MTAARPPYLALQHRDFRRMWIAQLVSLTGSQMQVAAINWHVYLLTGSALALGFVGLTRVIPIIVFSLWGGVIADRYDRRRIMMGTQGLMTVVAIGLAVSTITGRETLWLVYALNALSAAAVAFDGPSRQALVPRLVPSHDLQGALALNLTIFHASMIAGPALAGLLIAGGAGGAAHLTDAGAAAGAAAGRNGLAAIYSLNALSFLAVILALATMKTSGRAEPGEGSHEHPFE